MKNKEDNYIFLTQGPLHRVILTMAIPTIITMLVTSLYNIVDTYFVGQLNTQAIAAVGIVFSVMFFINAVGFYFGHGSGNYIARELGARRMENANIMANNGFAYSLFFGLLFTVVGEILLKPFAIMLGSTPTILPYTEQYMSIILLGAPFFTSSLTLNNQMRMQGNARLAMYGMVSGAILNCLFDPLFIFVFDMGVKGAALATVLGQVISFVILICMTFRPENISLNWHHVHPSWNSFREIFYGGSPSLSRQGLACLATVSLNLAAGPYGDAAIAAMSVVNRITMFIYSSVVGLGQGFQPVCGFCYGGGFYERMKKAFWFTSKVGTVFLIIIGAIGIYYNDEIIGLFSDDQDVIAIGSVALVWQLVAYPLNAFSMTSNMMMQVCRKPWRANILAAARQGLFFIPIIFVGSHLWGIAGVEMSQGLSDICSFLLTVPVMFYSFRQFSKQTV